MQVPQEEQRKVKDFYQFTEEELPFWERFDSVGVQGRAGSLFLWDSRTVHAVRLSCPFFKERYFCTGLICVENALPKLKGQ